MEQLLFHWFAQPARLGIRRYTRNLVRQIQYDRLDPIWGNHRLLFVIGPGRCPKGGKPSLSLIKRRALSFIRCLFTPDTQSN